MIAVSLATGRPVVTGPESELAAFRVLVGVRRDTFLALPLDAALVLVPGLPIARGVCSSCGAREHISPLRGGDCSACIVARFLAVEAMTAEVRHARSAARTQELCIAPVDVAPVPVEAAPVAPVEPVAPAEPATVPTLTAPLAKAKRQPKAPKALASLF